MLPFRHVGGHNPGQWLGLIDAVYGIAMTLMIFDLPKTLKQIAVQYTLHPQYIGNQTFDFAVNIIDYILIFLILYEIWCFHKTILLASSNPPHRLHGHITAIILVFVSITPACTVFLLNAEGHELLSSTAPTLSYLRLRSTAFFLFLSAAISYGLLTVLARINAAQGDRAVLKLCRQSAQARCLLFTVFFMSSLIAYHYAYVWIRPNILVLGYIVVSFHQDHIMRWIRRPQ